MPITEIKEEEFNKYVLKNKDLAIVDFWSETCGPCKTLRVSLEEIAKDEEESGFDIFSIRADEAADLTSKYRIMMLPCLLFIKDGEVLQKTLGYKSPDHILEIIRHISGKR